MAIVDVVYYQTVYLGQEATECDFPALEARAEDVIGAMTHWLVTADTIASQPPHVQTLCKKAICAQVDFFAVNGLDSVTGDDGRGFSIGKYSVSGKSGSDVVKRGAMNGSISPLVIMYLERTGLMNPSVPVVEAMI